MPTKSGNDAFSAWTEFKRAFAASTSAASTMNATISYRIARLRSDGGWGFDNADMQDDLPRLGIIW